MEFLKAQIGRLQTQINGLNASQKMLTMALAAIMAMTLLWWARYAGTPEMEALLEQDLSADELGRMKLAIAAKGITVQTNGARLMVPADRKFDLIAELGFQNLLPSNTEAGIDQIITKMSSPFNPASTNDVMWKRVKETTLAQIIGRFPRVRRASIVLDNSARTSFQSAGESSATVYVEMKPNERGDRKLAGAAATTVMGAVSGMRRSNVHVIVDGAEFNLQDADSEIVDGSELMSKIREYEQFYASKIKGLLNIDGAMVAVTVKPHNESKVINSLKIDKDNVVQKEIRTESNTKESRTESSAGEPGAVSNVVANGKVDLNAPGAPAASAGGERNSTNDNNEKADFVVMAGKTEQTTRVAGGDVPVVAATVRIPRSYFVRVWKERNPDQQGKDPGEVVVKTLIDAVLPDIRAAVKACTALQDDAAVAVAAYTDVAPLAMAAPQAASTPMSMLLGSHAKEIALGVLAAASLFVVSMMAKKGAAPVPAAAVAAAAASEAKAKAGPRSLSAESELAGEVGEASPSLDGIELDPESARSQQVHEQVASMVKENPDAAANLVKKWLNRA